LKLNGQVAIITGCGGGIGRAIALHLAREGVNIVVNDIVQEAAADVAGEVEKLGVEALVSTASVTQREQVEEMVAQALEQWGRIDILVNNAGITRDGLLVRMTDEQWDAVLDINLKGAFICTRAVARPMMKARYGRIINIASVAGVMGNAGQANYSASKGGLIALTKATAKELAGRGINCNAVAPGFIETPMTEQLPPDVRESWMQLIPLRRAGTADDVAGVVVFLAGPQASYITGQVINIDGGMIM